MAHATHLTIGTADRIRLDANVTDEDGEDIGGENEVRQEVQVSITYVLDIADTDLTALAAEKAGEVQRAHEAAWNRIGALHRFGTFGKAGSGCCRDGGKVEESDEEESIDEPDEVAPRSGWYLPGASLSQNGTGTRNGVGGHEAVPRQSPARAAEAQPDAEPLTGAQRILIRSHAAKIGLTAYALETLLFQQFKVIGVERLSKPQAAALLTALERDVKEHSLKEQEERKAAMGGFGQASA